MTKPTTPYNLSNGSYTRNSYAVFASADFGFRDYLFLNLTARNEWSSVLPKDKNSFFYPSVGLSFIPTKAFAGIKGNFLSYAKIATNLTRVGNASSIGWYDINDVAGLGSGFPFSLSGPTGGGLSFGPDAAPVDKHIKPEFVTTFEVSLDLGFFDNRVNLNTSYYNQKTTDLITYQSTSRASGIYRNKINVGAMQVSRIEVDLGLTPVRTKDFEWKLNLSYYNSNSKVLKVTDQSDEVVLQSNSMVGIYAVKGESFPLIKANAYERDEQGRIIIDAQTGNPKYTSELETFGTTSPKHIFGLNTAISYKGFELSAVMDYRTGHKFFSTTATNLAFNGTLKESAEFDRTKGGFVMENSCYEDPAHPGTYIENKSIKTGGDDYQSVATYYNQIYNRIGENFIFDASAFKVREVTFSYTFDKEQLGNKATSLTLGIYARNPFVVLAKDNLNYNDPETSNTSGNGQGIAGVDQYPSLRTYGFNVNVKF